MRIVLTALVFLAVMASAPVHAASADEATCRAAIQEKKACVGNRKGSPQLTACVKAAIARCKAKGVGAI